MKSNPELYTAILAFDIDGGPAKLGFAARLARENRWTREFAERVVREYKRFAYLCVAAGHPCTPSDEVDQAWHLHMVYTESYWRRFCGETLGKDLHHGPTKGGEAENEKFDDWYERTLRSYEAEFGEAPPADIWPPSEVRFGLAPHFARVNMQTNFVVPKADVGRLVALTLAALAVIYLPNTATERLVLILALFVLYLMKLAFENRHRLPVKEDQGERERRPLDTNSGMIGGGLYGASDSYIDHGGASGCGSSGCSSSGCSSGCGGGGCGGGGGS